MKTKVIILFLFLPFQIFGQKNLERKVINDMVSEITETFYLDDQSFKQGEYKYYYKFQEQIIGNYKDNLKNGVWTYMPHRNFKITGEYENDKKNNKWIIIEGKQIISVLNYKNDQLDGIQIGYFSNGNIATELNYENGKLNGIVKKNFKNGKIRESLSYVNGKLHGDYLFYSNNGELISKLTYFNNTPINIENISNDSSLILLSGNLENGNGIITTYIYNEETNNCQIYLTRQFKDSVLHGEIIGYDYNGSILFQGQYLNGYMDGKWVFYNSDGRINMEKTYSYKSELVNDPIEKRTLKYEEILHEKEQKMPMFNGNDAQLFRRFIDKNLKQPVDFDLKRIQGRVFVRFVINEIGQVVDSKVVKSSHPLIESEALRVVNLSPIWSPGIQLGIPVRVSYVFPVTFGKIQ